MWALRRACLHLRNQPLSSGTARICSVKAETESCCLVNYNTGFTQSQANGGFHNTCCSPKSFLIGRSISSLTGAESSEGDNAVLKNASSSSGDVGVEKESDELDAESDVDEDRSPRTEAISGLTQVILSDTAKEAFRVLDEWAQAGNEVTPDEVSSTVLFLQSRRLYAKVLQLYEWLESREKIEFTESNYSSRVDSIVKVQGSFKAEEYIQKIPELFRGESVYRSLLRNYTIAMDMYKSEKLFKKMKNLFPLTVYSCNQMLFLYKTDQKKIAGIMDLMAKENIKPSNLTYQILIDVEGKSNNIGGLERIFELMKSNGVEPNLPHREALARYYAAAGLMDKAEAVLKDMEGGDLVKNRAACYHLLLAYASLGRDGEVGRIWRECESDPSLAECIAAVRAWGQLKRIEDAEAAFEKVSKILGNHPSSKHYAIMLYVYADHNMVTKGEDLFRRMRESGVSIRMQAWDALMKLYVGTGDMEKADAILDEVIQNGKGRPLFITFLRILEGFAARGDVHSAEKIFLQMRKVGYTRRPRPYHSLMYAYINAKTPVEEGFAERLRRDNVVPDNKLARLLARVAAFKSDVVV